MDKFCSECGKQINENGKFCANCGHAVTEVTEKEDPAKPDAVEAGAQGLGLIVGIIAIVLGFSAFFSMCS